MATGLLLAGRRQATAIQPRCRDAEAAGDGILGGGRDAPFHHAGDVRRPEPGVRGRELGGFERRHLLGAADVLGEGELAEADDRGTVPERHGPRLAHRARGRKREERYPVRRVRPARSVAWSWIALPIASTARPMNVPRFSAAQSRLRARRPRVPWKRGITKRATSS